ncbi:MAG: hypothetical protein SRB1_00279 [Desulfobacteraceae bacterium Eth-SRB1]|nr:MAG: hypothetical protein SRB1_00279 [Desulfobacteraceae bacterium Eth-SRB1]
MMDGKSLDIKQNEAPRRKRMGYLKNHNKIYYCKAR